MSNEIISKYIALREYSFIGEDGTAYAWKNTNAHFRADSPYYLECVTGMKTGSLGKYSLLVSAVINDKTYIIGILGAPTNNARYEDSYNVITELINAVKES